MEKSRRKPDAWMLIFPGWKQSVIPSDGPRCCRPKPLVRVRSTMLLGAQPFDFRHCAMPDDLLFQISRFLWKSAALCDVRNSDRIVFIAARYRWWLFYSGFFQTIPFYFIWRMLLNWSIFCGYALENRECCHVKFGHSFRKAKDSVQPAW